MLDPNTIFFLGDLFDGGREWATPESHSPDSRYKHIGGRFWRQEYIRFASIFLKEWGNSEAPSRNRRDGRRTIASLPGNHDLGFGGGIQRPVRDRFHGWFGEGNRVDVIGNHTFVSVDTVSLSAKEHEIAAEEIYKPASDFLSNYSKTRQGAVARHLNLLYDVQITPRSQRRELIDAHSPEYPIRSPKAPAFKAYPDAQLPSILLTHVPLYRPAGTPCGPLRERWPPSNSPPTFPDDANAIRVSAGYQYQNVLTPTISSTILTALGLDLTNVFSGDDHDYCEVLHEPPQLAGSPVAGSEEGRIKEITVKALSWAMGVRKPGFEMVSLWNPIDSDGRKVDASQQRKTVHTHLCLLPEQLAIFIHYGALGAISLLITLIQAFRTVVRDAHFGDEAFTLLPRAKRHKSHDEGGRVRSSTANAASGATSSMSRHRANMSASINKDGYRAYSTGEEQAEGRWKAKGKTRGGGGASFFSALASVAFDSHGKRSDDVFEDDERWTASTTVSTSTNTGRSRRRRSQGCSAVLREWALGVWRIARVVLVWYVVLLYW